jgi:hypothetical protein
VDSAPSGTDAEPSRIRIRPGRWLAPVLILALSTIAVLVYGGAYPTISPYDEMAHLDALHQALDLDVVRRGERIGVEPIREAACAGAEFEDSGLPPCPRPGRPPDSLPVVFTNADLHAPVYYFVSAPFAALFRWLGADTVLQAGRAVGGLWLGLGLLLLWKVGDAWAIDRRARIIVLLLVGSAPVVLHASSIVNPDATALAGGAAVLLAAIRWEQRRWSPMVPILVAFLAGALRSTSALAIGAVAVYLLLRGMGDARDVRTTRRRHVWMAAAVAVVGAISVLGWAALREVLAVSEVAPTVEFFRGMSLGFEEVFSQTFALLSPFRPAVLAGPISGSEGPGLLITGLVNVTVLTACFGSLVYWWDARRESAIGVAGSLAMLASGSLLVVANYAVFGVYFPIPGRYGLSLLPILGLAVAARLRHFPAIFLVGALAAASVIYAAATLLWP